MPVPSRHACAPPGCKAGPQLMAIHQAPDRALKHTVCSTTAAASAQFVAEKLQRNEVCVQLGFDVQLLGQPQPWQPQLAPTRSSTAKTLEQSQAQLQLLLDRSELRLQSIVPTQRSKQLPQQHQQRVALQPRAQEQRARFRDALRRCQTWEQLAKYLTTEQQQPDCAQPQPHTILPPQQQHQQAGLKCLWQHLSSQQATAALQHATQLASHQWRGQSQQGHHHLPAGSTGSNMRRRIDQGLQTVLRGLVDTAAAGVAFGDAVAAAQVLRATWKLFGKQDSRQLLQSDSDQELRQLQQQLLDSMCGAAQSHSANAASAGAAAAAAGAELGQAQSGLIAGRPPVLKNTNLLADVSAVVVQLQLQPSSDWLEWYRAVSLDMMQSRPQQQHQNTVHQAAAMHTRRQQELGAVTSWFLVNAMQLAQYVHQHQIVQQQQQQQDLFAAAGPWQEAWCASAAALNQPFNPTQLILVAAAAAQLRMQLPPSFLQAHLQPECHTKFAARDLMRLLQILANLQQQHHQQQQQWKVPGRWLIAAAEAVPIAAAELAEGDAAAARLLPGAVCAAAKLKVPLNQAGLEQLLEALLAQAHLQQPGLLVTGAHAAAIAVPVGEAGNPKVGTDRSSSNLSRSQRRPSALRLAGATEACSALVALAQISKHRGLQLPPLKLIQQLQQQLRPMLGTADTSDLTAVLWAVRVVWKTPMSKPFMAVVFGVTQRRLQYCSANQLRLLLIALAAAAPAPMGLPAAWAKQYMASTAEILTAKQASFTRLRLMPQHMQAVQLLQQTQQQQDVVGPAEAAVHAAFLANVACCLAKLKIVPGQHWRALWQQQVVSVVGLMTPDQVVDVLYAAAVWANQPDNAHVDAHMLTTEAQSAGQGDSSLTQLQACRELEHQAGGLLTDRIGSDPVQYNTAAPATAATAPSVLQDDQPQQQQQHLLPKPVYRAASAAAAEAATPQVGIHSSTIPPTGWVNAVLLQLRWQMSHSTPKQLTTVLWCLNKLRFRAAVPWLDALYDGLINQLSQCSLLQLQQLLRGLVHQGLQLAPARIDHVLDAALRHMHVGSSSASSRQYSGDSSSGSLQAAHVSPGDYSRAYACTEQQLVWLLQLVVQLKHDPDPQWGQAVARVAQHMLVQRSRSAGSNSSSNTGWDASLLTELLDSFALLGVQLPKSWMACYRQAVWRAGLRSFSGLQLAHVLSSLAALHCSAVARPFLQGILQHLIRQLHSMDPHALGLAGVAVGQLGLVPARQWSLRYLQRVQQLIQSKIRVSMSDAANLQRSVQYTRWCVAHSSSRRGRKRALIVKKVVGRPQKCCTACQQRQRCRVAVARQA